MAHRPVNYRQLKLAACKSRRPIVLNNARVDYTVRAESAGRGSPKNVVDAILIRHPFADQSGRMAHTPKGDLT